MTTTSELIHLIKTPMSAIHRGRIMRASQIADRTVDGGTANQMRFLREFAAQTVEPPIPYDHPGSGNLPARAEGPLTDADMAWLQRLPANPGDTSVADAKVLAAMDRTVSKMKHPDHARLVASYWQPVKELNDRAAAQVELLNAKNSGAGAPIPSGALAALTDAVRAENPNLYPDEAQARATRLLNEANATRNATHSQRIARAEDAVTQLEAAAAQRTATTRA